jgi:hypothetical protein
MIRRFDRWLVDIQGTRTEWIFMLSFTLVGSAIVLLVERLISG